MVTICLALPRKRGAGRGFHNDSAYKIGKKTLPTNKEDSNVVSVHCDQ